jgi:uncharacterized damage-inducible protein DinB
MQDNLAAVIQDALIAEVEELRDAVRSLVAPLSEKDLWAKPVVPGNSIGHLVLHVTGNLNHFIGAQLGKTGYVRDREREFTETQPPDKAALLASLDAAVAKFRRVVEGLTPDQLAAPHPDARLGSVVRALMRSMTHLALHRGQMSYIVRLVK